MNKENKNTTKNKNYVSDYCVLDFETTGFLSTKDEIIEIGILKIENNKIVSKYEQLIKPNKKISEKVEEITGIKNDMIKDAPKIEDDAIQNTVKEFIGDSILIGHNIDGFDIKFLEKNFNIKNQTIDTLKIANKIKLKERYDLKDYTLDTLSDKFNLSEDGKEGHRALEDCKRTKALYDFLKIAMREIKIDEINKIMIKKNKNERNTSKEFDVKDIFPIDYKIDKNNFFYGKQFKFTGRFKLFKIEIHRQIIKKLGGIDGYGRFFKNTSYLILGNNGSEEKKSDAEKHNVSILKEEEYYEKLKENGVILEKIKKYEKKINKRVRIDIKSIKPNISVNEIDKNNTFFDENVVVTGEIKNLRREDLYQKIVNSGGKLQNNITKETTILISVKSSRKSGKLKKAEEYNKKGYKIKIFEITDKKEFDEILQENKIDE